MIAAAAVWLSVALLVGFRHCEPHTYCVCVGCGCHLLTFILPVAVCLDLCVLSVVFIQFITCVSVGFLRSMLLTTNKCQSSKHSNTWHRHAITEGYVFDCGHSEVCVCVCKIMHIVAATEGSWIFCCIFQKV